MNETFGRYTVIRQLGRGAMGVVYLASDPLLNRQVAVKTVDLAVEEPVEREFLRDRLLRDARAAAVLKHHNIVAIYDVFEDAGRACVVMEYIDGDSVASLLKMNPRPDVPVILKIMRQMADALDYTHARGVIHRDIKPANVMIDARGETKIMDFGIARITDARTVTPTGMIIGTVEYMSPEHVQGQSVDGRSDQFALGIMAYQMITGALPFGPGTLATLCYQIVNAAAPLPATRVPGLPPGADEVLMKALSKNPAERFVTCAGFAEALASVFANGGISRPAELAQEPIEVRNPPQVALTPPEVSRRSRPAVPLAIAGLILICAVAAALWRPWDRKHHDDVTASPSAASHPGSAPPASTGGVAKPPQVGPPPPPRENPPANPVETSVSNTAIPGHSAPSAPAKISGSASGVRPSKEATGSGGTLSHSSITATELPSVPAAIESFSAVPAAIKSGQTSTLRWSVRGVPGIRIKGIERSFPAEDSLTVCPTASQEYSLAVPGTTLSASAKVTVSITPNENVKLIRFAATPAAIAPGASVELSWRVENASEVSIEPDIGRVDACGTLLVQPLKTTKYRLTYRNERGRLTKPALVTVE
jgi:serine/threonine-protein kinase